MAASAQSGAREAPGLTTRHVVDKEAFESLVAASKDLRNAMGVRTRDLNGLDYAFGRVYRGLGFNPPVRKAAGAVLARDLAHDGHRAHDRRAAREVLGIDDRDPAVEALVVWKRELDAALRVVERAARRLPERERLAPALQSRGLFDEPTTVAHLGVKPRQAQNVANKARATLLGDPEVAAAYATVLDALGADEAVAPTVKAMLDDVFAGLADVDTRSS